MTTDGRYAPRLGFDGEAEDAATECVAAVPDASRLTVSRRGDGDVAPVPAGTPLRVESPLSGHRAAARQTSLRQQRNAVRWHANAC
jgi:hypothetical protein